MHSIYSKEQTIMMKIKRSFYFYQNLVFRDSVGKDDNYQLSTSCTHFEMFCKQPLLLFFLLWSILKSWRMREMIPVQI